MAAMTKWLHTQCAVLDEAEFDVEEGEEWKIPPPRWSDCVVNLEAVVAYIAEGDCTNVVIGSAGSMTLRLDFATFAAAMKAFELAMPREGDE